MTSDFFEVSAIMRECNTIDAKIVMSELCWRYFICYRSVSRILNILGCNFCRCQKANENFVQSLFEVSREISSNCSNRK